MKIIIPGIPIAKARPRRGKTWSKKPIFYDPQQDKKKTTSYQLFHEFQLQLTSENKEIATEAFKIACSKRFSLTFVFTLPYPRSLNQSKINGILWGFNIPDPNKDLDNMVKFYQDCGNNILWKDDAKIHSLHAFFCYGKNPQTEIEVTAIEEKKCLDKSKAILSNFSIHEIDELMQDLANIHSYIIFSKRLEKYDDLAYQLALFSKKYLEKMKKILKHIDIIDEFENLKIIAEEKNAIQSAEDTHK